MALSSRRIRGRTPSGDYWPGFVDAMSSLLLVLIFLLTIFMLVQFYLSQMVSTQDSALQSLRDQIAELASQLALEQKEQQDLRATISSLQESLASATAEQERLQGVIADQQSALGGGSSLSQQLADEKKLSAEAQAQVALLNQQINALRRQLAVLERALDAAETKDEEQKAQIADLGRRLNVALAQKVQELTKYRSDFFGRLSDIMKGKSDIEVVGDRFIIQSEIFFSSGSASINPAALPQLTEIANVIKQLETEIPSDIPWVLRVDGHTDDKPISTPQYPSNWYLSAARAISVVKYLVDEGVAPKRLVAAGFGEYQPLATGNSPEDLRRNRRIEFKLTER